MMKSAQCAGLQSLKDQRSSIKNINRSSAVFKLHILAGIKPRL
jgi:hypothetical protein